MMYQDEITVTASNSVTELERIPRINRVIGYLCALSEIDGNLNFLSKIKELSDEKGTLIVTWHTQPSAVEQGYVSKAWKSKIGDGSDNIEMIFPN
ncbi:MAG: hypothetical protein WA154_15360 [Moraxellaceae bacterium]